MFGPFLPIVAAAIGYSGIDGINEMGKRDFLATVDELITERYKILVFCSGQHCAQCITAGAFFSLPRGLLI